ncbi:uncharacterized protein [Nicotiana tomentosiformis]|uniref:uncharacterized protein n=1 Tax=Nicotiana tomentosiformis TaxID=4098 RepID=UPI00388C4A76
MIHEAYTLEGRSYEGIQGATDIHGFLDGFESAPSEDATGFGDLSASVSHHEAFLRITEEHKAEDRELNEKNDTYKLLNEKLQADLVTAQDEHAEMAEQVFRFLHYSEDELEITTNDLILQAWQRLEQIGQLQTQVDVIQAEAEDFKKNMGILASKKECVQAQLESGETQFQAEKEKALVQVEKIEELQSQLDLVVSDKTSLVNELEVDISEVVVAISEVTVANKRDDAKVAQFRVDVEVNQAKAKGMVKHAK